MKSIVPTYLLLIAFLLLTLMASSLIAFQIEVTAAHNYHTQCIDRIQSSYFNDEVIAECTTNAPDNYTVSVEKQTIYDDRPQCLVTLEYDARLPFLGVNVEDVTIQGYAK